MTREQLDQANAAVIRKWGRTIADMSSTVPGALLDDLAGVAEQHATETVGEAVTERAAARRRPKNP